MADLKPEDVIGKPFEEAYWWSYSETVQAQLRDAIERARNGDVVAYDVKLRVVRKVDYRCVPVGAYLRGGRLKYLLPSAVDITQREQYEQELQQVNSMLHWHQQRLNRIVNNIPGMSGKQSSSQRIDAQRMTFVSDQVEKMLGFTPRRCLHQSRILARRGSSCGLQHAVEKIEVRPCA